MSKVRFKYRPGAQYDLRRMPELVALLEEEGRSRLNDANSTMPNGRGYAMSSKQGSKRPQGRWAVRIYTLTNHAKRSNAKHNTLVRLLGGKGQAR